MTEQVLVLVDGSNVIHAASWRMTGQEPAVLVDRIGSWAARHGHRAVVVFDGAGPATGGIVGVVEVMASGSMTGDDVLEREASRAFGRGVAFWVVSDDQAVRRVAGARAVRVVDTAVLLEQLQEPGLDETTAASEAGVAPSGSSRVGDQVDPHVRARLEQLRRGPAREQ